LSSEKLGNAGALGLCAFGLTTLALMLHNNGLYGMNTMILAMGMFYGGIVQLLVGALEWKHGNTFGTVAFASYGAFWLSFCFMLMLPAFGLAAPDAAAVGWFMALWTVFTFAMFVGTLRIAKALQLVFGLGTIGFALLALNDLTGIEVLGDIAAVVGVLLGCSALYAGLAEVLNEVYGKVILPIGPVVHAEPRPKQDSPTSPND
jgi:succinate-acetate transporter protein